MDVLDRKSPTPLYHQLRELLRERLLTGIWDVGDSLPTEQELCEMYGVSRTTARAALDDLARTGLISRERGRGTFAIGTRGGERFVQSLGSFYQEMAARGYSVTSDVIGQDTRPASDPVSRALQIPDGTAVVYLARVRRIDGEPVLFSETFVPFALCPDVLDADLTAQSLAVWLEQQYGFRAARAHRVIEAMTMPEPAAKLLDTEHGDIALRVESTSYLDDGTPLEYSVDWHRGDKTKFEVDVVREGS